MCCIDFVNSSSSVRRLIRPSNLTFVLRQNRRVVFHFVFGLSYHLRICVVYESDLMKIISMYVTLE